MGVGVHKDVVLRAVDKVVQVVVDRRRESALEHVVALIVKPVEGLLGAVRAVGRNVLQFLVGEVCATSTGQLRLGHGRVGRRSSDVALESVHVV